ncbi:MAG TPA: hypothetical protein VEZ24_02475 [Microvirga sp.]|nr:hypothetical protein [Microvirga sp.]
MSRRGKAHSGICAIGVASLLCGSNPALLSLGAQPLPQSYDHPADESGASFDERFSSGDRIWPVFMHPEIQGVIAVLPPLAPPAEGLATDTAAEPPSAENTASLAAPAPAADPHALPPGPEMPLPEFPPPPAPAEVVLPSQEELAAAQPQALSPPAASTPGVSGTEAAQPSPSRPRAEKKRSLKASAGRKAAPARRPAAEQDHPVTTGSLPACRASTTCVSPQQSFAILFGFIAGGLLGGPIGAIAGGTAGALMTAPGAGQSQRSDPARP